MAARAGRLHALARLVVLAKARHDLNDFFDLGDAPMIHRLLLFVGHVLAVYVRTVAR